MMQIRCPVDQGPNHADRPPAALRTASIRPTSSKLGSR